MTSMAKIFVVVNLVLAAAVFGSAAVLLGAQDDYRNALEEATKKAEEYETAKKAELLTAETKLRNLGDANAKLSGEKAKAEATANEMRTQAAAQQTKNASLVTTVETYASTIERLSKVVEQEKEAQARFSQEAAAAVKDKLDMMKKWEDEVANRQRLEVSVARATEQVNELTGQKGDLENELRAAKFWIDEARKTNPELGRDGPQGKSGVVNSVKDNLVGISVGNEDGVRMGDIYHVRRGSSYVGRIRIVKVTKGTSVGQFETDFTGSGKMPETGDQVYPQSD
jgi:hypothetical protein